MSSDPSTLGGQRPAAEGRAAMLSPIAHEEPMPRFGRGFWTLFSKETTRFLRVLVQTVVTPLVTAGLYLTVFVGGLGRELDGLFHGVSYLHYLVPGLAMMGALNHAFNNAASSFMISKFQNNLVDLLVTPLTDLEIAFAYAFASVIRGSLVGVLTWSVTLPFGGPVPEHPLAAVGVMVLGAMIFAFLGVGAGVYANKFDDLARITTFVILPFTYLGAVFIPISKYPPFAYEIAQFNPLLYLIDGLRHAVLGQSGVSPWLTALVLTSALAITLSFSLLALRKASSIRN